MGIKNMRTVVLKLFFFIFITLLTSSLFSFSFEPITCDFSPSGPDATRNFRLINDGPDMIAVKITMLTRIMDEYGGEINKEVNNLFVIYPARIVLKPQSSQSVRIKWQGPEILWRELCYRILVEQVPVNFGNREEQGGNIRILFRYLGAAYVVPEGVFSDVVLESFKPVAGMGDTGDLELVFFNKGTAHTILGDLEITLTGTDKKGNEKQLVLRSEDLPGVSGENILPESRRRFKIPFPTELRQGEVSVSFSFEEVR